MQARWDRPPRPCCTSPFRNNSTAEQVSFSLQKTSPLFVTLFAWEKAVDRLEKVSDGQYQG